MFVLYPAIIAVVADDVLQQLLEHYWKAKMCWKTGVTAADADAPVVHLEEWVEIGVEAVGLVEDASSNCDPVAQAKI